MTKQFLPELFTRPAGFPDLFTSLQREIDQVFRDFGRGLPMMNEMPKHPNMLKLNVAETDKMVEVTADVPGVEAKDIDIVLKDDVLTIRGEKKEEKEDKQKDYHLVERNYGMFERSWTLPAEVDGTKVTATFDKGVLKVMLPKLPEAQAKVQKIEVKSAG